MTTLSARRSSARRLSTRAELGSGLLSASIGIAMLLGLLMFSLHVLLALHTRSVVTAVAWDAARSVARDGGPDTGEAQTRAVQLLSGLRPHLSWDDSTPDTVVLTVSVTSPGLVPGITSLDSLRQIQRTVRVRREGWR